jgi:phthalate 4,5-dioxygenase oxygenase subunit
MLTADDNAALTQVGPDKPLGKFFRRYWIPACKSEEIREPGGAPARVELLGEKLVAFRDPGGKPGLMGEFCPHRRASLFYGRNEEGGLRCLYHGWKMGHDGKILETPAEPKTSKLAANLCHNAYPVREAGGVLWTYMGPRELQPPFPNFPWLNLPEKRVRWSRCTRTATTCRAWRETLTRRTRTTCTGTSCSTTRRAGRAPAGSPSPS